MTTIVGIGEAMGELTSAQGGAFNLGFAGDVFNTLAYIKLLGGDDCSSVFVTAIGEDPLSVRFADKCRDLGVALAAARESGQPLGLYLVSTDASGERSFTYWRSASPARRLVNTLGDDARASIASADILYLSGITLAILDEEQRVRLETLLRERRKSGARIAFDPNYRARLWENRSSAARWVERMYALSDIAFPGAEDERDLFGLASSREIVERPSLAGVRELVVKAGGDGAFGRVDGAHFATPFVKPRETIDTSGAGDSFNAAWLVARSRGSSPGQAAAFAARTASAVCGVKGAVAPREALVDA